MLERLKRLPLVVKYYRRKYPDESVCMCCGLPWSAVKTHFINVPGSNYGFFMDCEYCWGRLSAKEKHQQAKELYRHWAEDSGAEQLNLTLGQMLDAIAIEGLEEHANLRKKGRGRD